jgi:hypothetical protein
VLDQQLTRVEEEVAEEVEEVAEDTVTSLDLLKRQKGGRKYIFQFDT